MPGFQLATIAPGGRNLIIANYAFTLSPPTTGRRSENRHAVVAERTAAALATLDGALPAHGAIRMTHAPWDAGDLDVPHRVAAGTQLKRLGRIPGLGSPCPANASIRHTRPRPYPSSWMACCMASRPGQLTGSERDHIAGFGRWTWPGVVQPKTLWRRLPPLLDQRAHSGPRHPHRGQAGLRGDDLLHSGGLPRGQSEACQHERHSLR